MDAALADPDRRLRVLLVEDNADDAYLTIRTLERSGSRCAVRVVSRLPELDVALAHEPWDLVLADMALAGFNGHDVLLHVRRSQPQAPVIALSGLKRDPRGPEMLAAGAAGFVGKDALGELPGEIARVTRAAPSS